MFFCSHCHVASLAVTASMYCYMQNNTEFQLLGPKAFRRKNIHLLQLCVPGSSGSNPERVDYDI